MGVVVFSHSFSVRILHIIQQNGSSSYKDRKESCQAHHREILHSIDFGFPCEQTYLEEIAIIPSKPLRNKIAGFVTHLMKRLQHKTVRISIKLQEEERERRDNYVPETSVLDIDTIEIDVETKDMLKML